MTVERYDPPARSNVPALINPTTDSWTAVLNNVIDLANNISQTEFVPLGLRGSTPKVVAAILHGRELGLPPMTALAHTSVINGRPGTSAEVMRALILQAGHDLQIVQSDSEKCTIKGRRSDWAEDRWTTVSFSMADAAKAGLTEDKRTKEGKTVPSMYKKWPAELLLARASTRLARMVFSDVIHGMRSVEELQDMTEVGEWVETTPLPTAQVSRQAPPPAVEAGAKAQPVAAAPAPAAREGVAEVATPEAAPSQPAGRRRAPLTRRGVPIPAPQPESQAAQVVTEEPVDAEVIEESTGEVLQLAEPAQGATVTPLAEAKAVARQQTMTRIQMHFERLLGKPVDREERLWYTAIIIGRAEALDSTNQLTGEELKQLHSALEKCRDREQLEARYARPEGGE